MTCRDDVGTTDPDKSEPKRYLVVPNCFLGNQHLCDYTMIIYFSSDNAQCCNENGGDLNCIIGGGVNTYMSRSKSCNTVSFINYISNDNVTLVLHKVDNQFNTLTGA